MANTFGNNVKLTLFGESHNPFIGAVIDGLPAGINIDMDFIKKQMLLRKPIDNISTSRKEDDNIEFISGIFNNKTNGDPVCVIIKNSNVDDSVYNKDILRPGHADLVSEIKYHGYQDYRGGGHFSGRLTAPLVACCSIILSYLRTKNIFIGTRVFKCMEIIDDRIENPEGFTKEFCDKSFAMINEDKLEKIKDKILKAKDEGDSLGGTLETVITGLPIGVGEPWFDSLESNISHILFSIPGLKGIEFGKGFGFSNYKGSEVSDGLTYRDDSIVSINNFNGGINGGISNGSPVYFRTVIKPTSSISICQDTVNLKDKENCKVSIKGRHDPAIFPRVPVIINCLSAFCLFDLMINFYGKENV